MHFPPAGKYSILTFAKSGRPLKGQTALNSFVSVFIYWSTDSKGNVSRKAALILDASS